MSDNVSFPDQPIVVSDTETRFKPNKIVKFLIDSGSVDLNLLSAIAYLFTPADWEQFYQLIGYSVEEFCNMSVVSDEARERVVDKEYELVKEKRVKE